MTTESQDVPTADQLIANARTAQAALMGEKPAMPSASKGDLVAAHYARAANFEAMAAAYLSGKGQEVAVAMSAGQSR